uniref:Ig-like domain-containing protein n=1 Tax=Naja naja TaxID=35670 RepID=A0A8C6X0J3_NAJNA
MVIISGFSLLLLNIMVLKVKRRVDTMRLLEKPPEFTLPLYNRTAYVGENIRFGVTITVHPEPRVTWFKSGQKIKPGDDDRKYTFETDKGLYQLLIHNLNEDDDAEYTVLARNKYGEDSCKAKLTVVQHAPAEDTTLRPMFKRLLANAECQEGQHVCFEIRVSGIPKPTLKWEKDGQPLSANQYEMPGKLDRIVQKRPKRIRLSRWEQFYVM